MLSHLILFGYFYPRQRKDIPAPALDRLLAQLQEESADTLGDYHVCRGTLLSRGQYLPDVERWGYSDARLDQRIKMTPQEMLAWTTAIDHANRPR
jgi:hypothetical protein